MRRWTEGEIEELTILWWNYTPKEVYQKLKERSEKSIHMKALKLGLKRSQDTELRIANEKREIVIRRNKTVGRDRNYENAKVVALRYNSRTEFYRKDLSMYEYIRDNGLWDELCSHMVIGSFNYSESFLHECLKHIFPDSVVVRNSRKIIPPYELDFYIQDHKIAIEYDGSMWHSSDDVRERDATKTEKCLQLGLLLFRIKENRASRTKPEDHILSSLGEFGFDISRVNKEKCASAAFSSGYSEERIWSVVDQYATLKEFREKEVGLYTVLLKRGLTGKYLSHLERHSHRKRNPK